jgi:molecular chaperone GrpE (heat shock protein)
MNSKTRHELEEFDSKYEELSHRYERIKAKYDEINNSKSRKVYGC